MLCLHAAEIVVKETVMRRPKGTEPRTEPDIQRLEGLHSLLKSIEGWFHMFFDLPINDWKGTTFEYFVQYSHFVVILLRLTLLKEPGWDGNSIRSQVDVLDMLERIAQLVESFVGAMTWDDAMRAKEHAIVSAPRRIRAMIVDVSAELSAMALPVIAEPSDGYNRGLYDWVVDNSDSYYQEYPWLIEMLGAQPFQPDNNGMEM